VEEPDESCFDKGIDNEDSESRMTVRLLITSSLISSIFPPLNLTVHPLTPHFQSTMKYSNPSFGGVCWKYLLPHVRS